MKAFVLAAGLGTRLKPWTLEHPKALVPVAGVPMLRRVLDRLHHYGFDDVVVNVHHFAGQIVEYVDKMCSDLSVRISDESDELLDTGGGLLHAAPLLFADDDDPVLVHNVDILSDAPLRQIMDIHVGSGADVSLVTSPRESSRQLVFDSGSRLRGWHNLKSGEYRPDGFDIDDTSCGVLHQIAFSGIYVVSKRAFDALVRYSELIGSNSFPIMDFLLHSASVPDGSDDKILIKEIEWRELNLIDIGKPETLADARLRVSDFGIEDRQ